MSKAAPKEVASRLVRVMIDGHEVRNFEECWIANGGILVMKRYEGQREIHELTRSWQYARVERDVT